MELNEKKELKKELELLHEHIEACSMCQGTKSLTPQLENEHNEWHSKISSHVGKGGKCEGAKSFKSLCKMCRAFFNQDYRTIKGTRKFSRKEYYKTKDGKEKKKLKIYVKSFDPTIIAKDKTLLTAEDQEILNQYEEAGHSFAIYDMSAAIPDEIPKNLEKICKALLLGFTISEIAEMIGVHRDTIYEKLKKIQKKSDKTTPSAAPIK